MAHPGDSATSATATATATGNVYERLGVRPIINGQGTTTTLGGSMLLPEVAAAMAEAGNSMVLLKELNDAAGELIARHTGAEAGLVTAGAASGMLLQAAAVIAGTDPELIKRLPDTSGLKNEIIILAHHRDIGYIQAWRTAGARLVEVNIDSAELAESAVAMVMDAVGSQTAAIGFVATRWLRQDPPGFLPALTRAAHDAGIPVIADVAAMLPPFENLRRYTDEGVDLVSFSGGKAVRAPQSTGMLAGTKELIEAATLNAAPYGAVGRPAKVCKEEIVGLMTALEIYAQRDHAADQRRWRAQGAAIAAALKDVKGVRVEVLQDDHSRPVPEAAIFFSEGYAGPPRESIAALLLEEEPRIVLGAANVRGEDLYVNPHNLVDGEEQIVGARLRALLSGE